ncbi:hypothetical protein BOTBODRAFT_49438 [Botryobasidium botryosum FD-172 SS1]|uniref:F-box domain-containing protein n=1 Tax=Botryobasidium botryosum (strain FD-172 SS1) TaxID=930990 RepID=A0A067M3C0_BOTB1|nr:hypothetical protein BOTBODRAFT_49438 [Botryobasidium botryosum FD-172 SS1]
MISKAVISIPRFILGPSKEKVQLPSSSSNHLYSKEIPRAQVSNKGEVGLVENRAPRWSSATHGHPRANLSILKARLDVYTAALRPRSKKPECGDRCQLHAEHFNRLQAAYPVPLDNCDYKTWALRPMYRMRTQPLHVAVISKRQHAASRFMHIITFATLGLGIVSSTSEYVPQLAPYHGVALMLMLHQEAWYLSRIRSGQYSPHSRKRRCRDGHQLKSEDTKPSSKKAASKAPGSFIQLLLAVYQRTTLALLLSLQPTTMNFVTQPPLARRPWESHADLFRTSFAGLLGHRQSVQCLVFPKSEALQLPCPEIERGCGIRMGGGFVGRTSEGVASEHDATASLIKDAPPASINRLPFETIALIFNHVKPERVQNCSPLYGVAPLILLHVSRLWRQIALSMPKLWADINVAEMPPAMVAALLRWSRQSPLDIMYESHPRNATRHPIHIWRSLTPDAARWRTLRLRHVNVNRACLQAPAPQLEVLSITACEGTQQDLGGLFRGVTPRLRELELDGVYMPCHLPIYSGLTELRLARIGIVESPTHGVKVQPCIDDLILALESSPLLETLALQAVQFSPVPAESYRRRQHKTISLSLLRAMRLCDLSPRAIYYLLTHVVTPPSMHLEVSVCLPASKGLEYTIPPSAIFAPSLQNLQGVDELCIRRDARVESCYTLEGFSSHSSVFSFTIHGCEDPAIQLAPSLGQIFCTPLVRTLSVENLAANDVAFFNAALGCLPSIDELVLLKSDDAVVRALVDRQRAPSLQVLCMSRCSVTREVLLQVVRCRTRVRSKGGSGYGGESGKSSWPADMVELEHLSILGCPSITEADAAELSGYLDVDFYVGAS